MHMHPIGRTYVAILLLTTRVSSQISPEIPTTECFGNVGFKLLLHTSQKISYRKMHAQEINVQ